MLVVAINVPGVLGAAAGQVLANRGAELRTVPAGYGRDVRVLAGMVGAAPGLRTIAALHEGLVKHQAGPRRDTGALDAFLHP